MSLTILDEESQFPDRPAAGRRLAAALEGYATAEPLVLGIPRGGVVVAAEVAAALGADLDVALARKLGLPGNPELAMGALGEGGELVLNEIVVGAFGVSHATVERAAAAAREEIERRARLYRGTRGSLDARNRTVIVVDDGTATGATVRAAIDPLRAAGAGRVIVALPVGPPEALEDLASRVDEVVALVAPAYFSAVGNFYEDFSQTSDEEVLEILERFAARRAGGRT